MRLTNDPQYIGDGVYVSTDGYHVVLELKEQPPVKIYLDSHVRNTLYHILKEELDDTDN